MKSSFISSSAIQNAMRLTIRQTQKQLVSSTLEATTGVYADIGASLGSGAAKSVNFTSEISRIAALKGSNSVVNMRLEASQLGLNNMKKAGDDLVSKLTALQGSQDKTSLTVAVQSAGDALSSLMDTGNSMVNGEYLFSGINTDVQPLNSQANAATTAIQTNLTAYASGLNKPVNALTGAEMNTFITNFVQPMFTQDTFNGTSTPVAFPPPGAPTPVAPAAYVTPPAWGDWSNASNQNMTSRISNSEVVTSSTNANSEGMRYFALASITASALVSQGLSSDGMSAVTSKAIGYAAQATSGIVTQASQLGLSQERVKKANDALDAQSSIIQNKLVDLQGVDTYKASTLVNALQTQLETAYTLISKIQQLSLVNYL
ncbi:flagellar hook-associated family protein [Rhizobium sp. Root1220]|uniref:flagellar hook-associated family protein n=1 Tax=Rhizobium sp. Root1220 TaxID=1736432 RepID=UPI0006F3878D|nr:flagellar hook-associated family protein [Rhizobium sp. Root1220]KQV68356.1 flagellar biosynthesis protein FlgL [Rhizobium sp. Root1220]